MPFALKARCVLPISGPPLPGGVVTIEGERIVAVGRDADAPCTDLGDVALLPGFVNAHTHLEFSDLAAPLGTPGMTLIDWIREILALRGRKDYDPAAAVKKGLRESAAAGVTAIGDIVTLPADEYPLGEAPCSISAFAEVIGFSQARGRSILPAVEERLDALGTMRDLSPGISPHAPYTVSLELVRRLAAISAARRLPLAMHLAESREEVQFVQQGDGPFRELLQERSMWDAQSLAGVQSFGDYIQAMARAHRSLIVHGNFLSRAELQQVSAHQPRMSLIYCPRTHAYFNHAAYPLSDALAQGINVALGTDSRASNPDLSLIAEMRFVARRHPDIDPRTIVELGTRNGARALGIEADHGTLEPGKLANVVAVELPPDRTEPHEAILGGNGKVAASWHRGVSVAGRMA